MQRWVHWYGEGINPYTKESVDVGVYVWIGEGAAYQYVVTDQDGISAADAWERFEMHEIDEIRQFMFETFGIAVDATPVEMEEL